MSRRSIAPLTWVLAGALVAASGLCAQPFPAKPVRVVVPWPTGGANDVVGRIVMQALGEQLGQPFLIDNRPGAAGTVGAPIVAKAPPDGYTLMVHSATHVGNAHLYRQLPYDTLRDFTPIAPLASQPGVLVVHPSLPVKSVRELVALAKARPGQLHFASAGNGSAPHQFMGLFMHLTGARMLHVPYRGGAPSMTGLLAGEAPLMIAVLSNAKPHLESGKLRALAVTTPARLKALPDVPTMAEAGVAQYDLDPWVGFFGPGGVARDLLDRLNAETRRALGREDVSRNILAQGLEPMFEDADRFRQRVGADFERYARLYRLLDLKVE